MSSAHLLIVDDDRALAQMLRLDFQELGYRVSLAGSCRQARQILAETSFDLLLLDYHLADGKGTELLAMCHDQRPELPVILSSGDTQRQGLQAIARGSCRFVPKPAAARTLDRVFRELRIL